LLTQIGYYGIQYLTSYQALIVLLGMKVEAPGVPNSPECVVVPVVGSLKLDEHEIAGSDGRGEEEDLHGRVVDRDEARHEVQVSSQEH